MTQISPYGIGAGRMLAAASDDEDTRARQRRLTAAQLAEQSRKSAAMREQLVQAERSAALAEARGRQQQEQAGALRRERMADTPARPLDRRLPAEANRTPGRLLRPEAATEVETQAPADSRVQETRGDGPAGLPASPGHQLEQTPGLLVSRMIDDLPALRKQQFAAGIEERLDALRQSVLAARNTAAANDRDALEALEGSLEFMQGYLEASTMSDDTRQRLVLVIDGIRQDVSIMMSAFAGPPVGAATATAHAAHNASESLRVHGLFGKQRTARAEGRASRLRGEEGEGDDEAKSAAACAAVVMPATGIEPVRTAVPSQSRDVDKRRNDTPVSVAVRSV